MNHRKKLRLATAAHRPMTEAEHLLSKNQAIMLNLPVVYGVSTKEGGTLNFSKENGHITFVYKGLGECCFAMRCHAEEFLSMLRNGGGLHCPRAGFVTIHPLSGNRASLRLIPARTVTGPGHGLCFDAEISLDALSAS